MTVIITKPSTNKDYKEFAAGIALAIGEGLAMNPAGAASHVKEALWAAVGDFEKTPDTLALVPLRIRK